MQTIRFETEIQYPSRVIEKYDRNIDDYLKKIANRIYNDTNVFVGCTISEAKNRTFLEGQEYVRPFLDTIRVEPSCESVTVSGYYNPIDKSVTPEKWKVAVMTMFDEYRKLYQEKTGKNLEVDVIFNDGKGLDLQALKDDESLKQCTEELSGIINKQELEEMFK